MRGDTRREEPCPGVWLRRGVPRACPSIPDRGGYRLWGRGLTGRGAPLSHRVARLVTPTPPALRAPPPPPGGRGQCVGIFRGNPCLGVALDPVLLRPIPMQWTVVAIAPGGGADGEGARPIYANLTSRYSYPASVLVYFNHLAWSLPVAFCKIFCNEIPAFETFTQRQNRIYCAPEQTKCKRCLPPQIRLGGIFFTDVRATIPLPLEYAGVFLIPERRWGFLSLVCAEGIPRGKKNVLARQLQR